MENSLGENEKSAREQWKMRSVKIKNPLNKTGKICSVKLKNPLSKNGISVPLKWNIRSVKMEYPLTKIKKSAL
jgi:hypothetical protein